MKSITVEEALQQLLEHTPILNEEQMPLLKALGQRLTQNICADHPQPPFDRSPLDGYALRAADIAQASADAPVTLEVVDKLYAGDVSSVPVLPGQAVRLMTGSMVPQGADCVIRQEDTDEGEQMVRIFQRVAAGRNICYRGEEYQVGECLLSVGQRIDTAAIAVASGAGRSTLPVRRQAKAAVVSTGSELQRLGQPLMPGKIYDSNSAFLAAELQQMGAAVTEIRSVVDETDLIVQTLTELAGTVDLILTTGGVSVGQKDLMETAVLQTGGHIVFHGVDMKPGMPTMFAMIGNTMVLCLSGNPFSAAVPFALFVKPILARMAGDLSWEPHWEQGQAATPFPKSSPTRRFLRGTFQEGSVSIPSKQANGQMRSMIGSNCLLDIPAGTERINVADTVRVLMI